MKKAEYKVAIGKGGFVSLEEEVTLLLNEGWKPIGGLAFNAGHPYQAMARVVNISQNLKNPQDQKNKISKKPDSNGQSFGVQDAMRLVDELT